MQIPNDENFNNKIFQPAGENMRRGMGLGQSAVTDELMNKGMHCEVVVNKKHLGEQSQ